MSYEPMEVYRKKIAVFGITIWSCVKTVSQEKFYELVSDKVKKEIRKEFGEIRGQVSDDILKRINEQLGLAVKRARPKR